MGNGKEIRESLQSLFSRPDIRLVVLFGSAATETTTRRSDVDFAILADEPFDVVRMTNESMCSMQRSDVDIVDLRRASPLLAMQVVRHGVVLHERGPGRFASF
jgi:predicted nucleotidyltransferase